MSQEYNTVSEDLRADCEVRADLHQRVDDVRDRLWSISDERKEQAEAERALVMADSWLDDRLGLLDNQLITLMQAEVDRYHDTVILLRDYYRAMEGHVPDELATDYARLPLLEVSDQIGTKMAVVVVGQFPLRLLQKIFLVFLF